MTEKLIPCPRCKKQTIYSPKNPYRPFCSERCKLIDLGDWADEKFRVPSFESNVQDNTDSEDNDNGGI